MHLLVVTPMHNEASNVAELASTLRAQTFRDFTWVAVNDGSSDQTGAHLRSLGDEVTVFDKRNDGGLMGGSAYTSWRYGVSRSLEVESIRVTHVMKLDADVRLPGDYLERVLSAMHAGIGLAGGVLVGSGHREQAHHVPGPVKLYTRSAYDLLMDLPSAIGFDVLDEVQLAQEGLDTLVLKTARVKLARAIGASEGSVHGRFRNGRVCRWTGYSLPYFIAHAIRYVARRPYMIGAVAIVVGWATAGPGPYPASLRNAHARMQRKKLAAAISHPIRWFRETYMY